MKIIDISWPISEKIVEYKNKKSVSFKPEVTWSSKKMRKTRIALSNHTGTHVDAPSHFLRSGKTIDKVDLNRLVGPCWVIDLTHVRGKITREDLEPYKPQKHEIVLLKTRNSKLSSTGKFSKNFVYVDKTAAEYLVSRRVHAVGIDYLGIERCQEHHETHKTLLKHGVVVVEGLRLKGVKHGHYTFICLPLAVQGIDAAPARAVLLK